MLSMQRFTGVNPMLVRLSQRTYMNNTRIGMNSNNFLVLSDNDGLTSPKLKFNNCDKEISLDPHLSLNQVVTRMRRNNLVGS